MVGKPNRAANQLVRLALTLLAAGVACMAGCVERRYTVRTDPPGALVMVNHEEIGASPVSRSFIYYGDREVEVSADGYQTKRVVVPVNAPWYDNLLTEWFTENLVPWTIRDERDINVRLEPEQPGSNGDLVGRAQALRNQASVPPPPRRGGFLGWLGFD